MQLLPALTRDPKVAAREAPAGAHLPYARHLDPATIETRDGLLMQTIRLGGLLFETADSEELNYRAELRDAMLRTLGSSRYAVYHHLVRRRADVVLPAEYSDEFSERLNERWKARLAARELYVNDLFLTIIRRPLQGRIGMADRLKGWLGRRSQRNAALIAAEKHALDNARDALMAALGHYDPRLLTIYDTPDGPRSEPLELLSCLFNGTMRPVAVPHGDLGHHLPARRVSFGQDTVELGATGNEGRRFVAVVSIKDYSDRTLPGMFDDLHRLPFELTVSQSFAFVERREALGRMNLALRRMKASEDEALSLRDELGTAKDEVAAGRAGFGEHHTTIAIQADALKVLCPSSEHLAQLVA